MKIDLEDEEEEDDDDDEEVDDLEESVEVFLFPRRWLWWWL